MVGRKGNTTGAEIFGYGMIKEGEVVGIKYDILSIDLIKSDPMGVYKWEVFSLVHKAAARPKMLRLRGTVVNNPLSDQKISQLS